MCGQAAEHRPWREEGVGTRCESEHQGGVSQERREGGREGGSEGTAELRRQKDEKRQINLMERLIH